MLARMLVEAALVQVSVLFNEPKLLKSPDAARRSPARRCFSALQRAEIAEIRRNWGLTTCCPRFSALQRAEIAEITLARELHSYAQRVSVLFNEPKLLKLTALRSTPSASTVSVLFNEPKLLKSTPHSASRSRGISFSALQRAEIAEISWLDELSASIHKFQCSSTSRNC